MLIAGLCLAIAGACGQVNLPPGFEIVDFAVSGDYTGSSDLNECGQIVFVKRLGDSWAQAEMFLYDNGKITRLTDNGDRDVLPRINNAGTIVWNRGLGDAGVTQVMIYENGWERVFDEDEFAAVLGSINDAGHIVWEKDRAGGCGFRGEIFWWDGIRKQRISRTKLIDQSPEINELDWIVWGRSDSCVNPWQGHCLLYRNGETIDLPTASRQSQVPAINNLGQIVWFSGLPYRNGGLELWDNGQTRVLVEERAGTPSINNVGDASFDRWNPDKNNFDTWLLRDFDGNPQWHRLTDESVFNNGPVLNDWGEAAWRWHVDPPRGNWAGGIKLLRRIRMGDNEFDGDIDQTDYSALAQCITGPNWDDLYQEGPTQTLCECRFLDIDHDGDVDLGDFARFQNAFTGD